MLTRDFIKDVLIVEIKQMTLHENEEASHPYIGFSIVNQSIECLGACFDDYDWGAQNLSGLRFRNAIRKLFPDKYKHFNNGKKHDLYNNLRCSLVHQMRPGHNIGLSERKYEKKSDQNNTHLTIQNEQLILIYEEFLDDFIKACKKTIEWIDNGKLTTQKAVGHIISVPQDYTSEK
jgi:hypothetical protein